MDLICDEIIRRLESNKQNRTVHLEISLSAPDTPKNFRLERQTPLPQSCSAKIHHMAFSQTHLGGGDIELAIQGVRYHPEKEVVKHFVGLWVESLVVERKGANNSPVDTLIEVTATVGGARVSKDSVRFVYYPESPKRNRRPINRAVERVMRVKALCGLMIE